MKLFDSMYVRTQSTTGLCTTSFPLAFMTPFDNTSAFAKRKETVDNWARSGSAPAEQLPNEPVKGFALEKVVSRYSTSNKLFRIQDPRGFTLEISADNLFDIVRNGSIDKGAIQGDYVWTRDIKGSNVLTSVLDPDYIKELAPKRDVSVGDLVTLGEWAGNTEHIYLGKFNRTVYKKEYYRVLSHSFTNPTPGSHSIVKTDKPVFHLFITLNKNYKGLHDFETRSSLKNVEYLGAPSSTPPTPKVGEFILTGYNELSFLKNNKSDESPDINLDEFTKIYNKVDKA